MADERSSSRAAKRPRISYYPPNPLRRTRKPSLPPTGSRPPSDGPSSPAVGDRVADGAREDIATRSDGIPPSAQPKQTAPRGRSRKSPSLPEPETRPISPDCEERVDTSPPATPLPSVPVTKRPRGRPRKASTASTADLSSARDPYSPAQSRSLTPQPQKRPRGRPRKIQPQRNSESAGSSLETSPGPNPDPHPHSDPELEPFSEPQTTTRRGRPKGSHATLYTTTAGRVPIRGTLPRHPIPPHLQHTLPPHLYSDPAIQRALQSYKSSLPKPASTRDTLPASKPLTPATALFKRAGAPDRFAEPEFDTYEAHRWLPSFTSSMADLTPAQLSRYPTVSDLNSLRSVNGLGDYISVSPSSYPQDLHLGMSSLPPTSITASIRQTRKEEKRVTELPESEMLKALHEYASHFYGRQGMGRESWRSMDETALLALGILIEEMYREDIIHAEGWRGLLSGAEEESRGWGSVNGARSVIEKKATKRRNTKSSVGKTRARITETGMDGTAKRRGRDADEEGDGDGDVDMDNLESLRSNTHLETASPSPSPSSSLSSRSVTSHDEYDTHEESDNDDDNDNDNDSDPENDRDTDSDNNSISISINTITTTPIDTKKQNQNQPQKNENETDETDVDTDTDTDTSASLAPHQPRNKSQNTRKNKNRYTKDERSLQLQTLESESDEGSGSGSGSDSEVDSESDSDEDEDSDSDSVKNNDSEEKEDSSSEKDHDDEK